MLKKKEARPRKKPDWPKRKSRIRRKSLVVVGLLLCLGLTSAVLTQWRGIRSSFSPPSPLPQTSGTPQLSKEYIYASGRLIATEEPGGGASPLSAPASLTATGASTPQINLTWTASTGGTVDHYQVERSQDHASGYTVVAPSVTTTSYSDTSVSPGAAYLYRVRAVDSSNNLTNYSNIDLATTITFEDDPLISYAENPTNATPIRAVHLNQLRQAVNAVRALAGKGLASWTYPDPVSSPPEQRRQIYLEDITELRTELDEALIILGMSQSYPTNPVLARGSAISAAHFMQIRARVK
jgi:Fibronectin type III domain